MSRKHYCIQITKWGVYKQCPFAYISLDSKHCCGFHNMAVFDHPKLDRDERGLKGFDFCVYSSWKNKIKGVWRILFFQ